MLESAETHLQARAIASSAVLSHSLLLNFLPVTDIVQCSICQFQGNRHVMLSANKSRSQFDKVALTEVLIGIKSWN